MRGLARGAGLVAIVALGAACSGGSSHRSLPAPPASTSTLSHVAGATHAGRPRDIYAADRPNDLAPAVANVRPLVYVPNSMSNTVDVIDPATFRVIRQFATGRLPQHVVPAWDLRHLYVTNDLGNSLTPIDPRTGAVGAPIPVADPYNMYFTPDGKFAIVVAEKLQRLDFRDPHTFRLVRSVHVPCRGVDHMDFSANGRMLVASCEFSGQLVQIDIARAEVVGTLRLGGGHSKPQDVKLDPTGRTYYVADMTRGGVYTIDAASFRVTGFIATGAGAHGLYVSRDSTLLYVTNRDAGNVSLIRFASRAVVATWFIPGGGSPDMGGLSADGTRLWVSGRSNAVVYVFDTTSGALLHRIPVGAGPHGLCVFPQPGRYSLGHTGVFR